MGMGCEVWVWDIGKSVVAQGMGHEVWVWGTRYGYGA